MHKNTDRRETKRKVPPVALNVEANIDGVPLVEYALENISADGICFSGATENSVGRKISLSILLNSTSNLKVLVQIIWTKTLHTKKILHGASILNFSHKQLAILSELLHNDDEPIDRRKGVRRGEERAKKNNDDRRFPERLKAVRIFSNGTEPKRRVVITGIGIVSPLGIGKSRFLNNLIESRTGIRFIPELKRCNFPTFHGGVINDEEIKMYLSSSKYLKDGTFQKFSRLDRATLLAMLSTIECLEDAGIVLKDLKRQDIGCSVGTVLGGLEFAFKAHEDYNKMGTHRVNPYTVANATPNASSGELTSNFGLRGPSATFSQGCTSGLNAITYALSLIQNGMTEMMLAGGTDSPFHQTIYASFCRSKMLSPSFDEGIPNHVPFDTNRKGTVLAEGSAFLLLEELNHAIARKASIYSEIKGEFITSDGFEMTKPRWHGTEATRAMKSALTRSGVNPEDLSAVFAHATGSIEGDEMETIAMHNAFGGSAKIIPVTNIKSLMGYSQASCGPFEVATACLGIKNRIIPGIAGFKGSTMPLNISNRAREIEMRNVMINCFGFGGKNISLVLANYNE